ncbi:flagellar biosynthetic protein FliO [Desulfonatronovibrio hydrogenovorans]|uniref:flagellar biosynthetic protein FliO n=1 Tax=Desulfonatronovibrio hydrogenovorans TaxID=53245 RepID=UPI00048BE947|nr:flagellar biosynthetic protein FliO [Desulfonatronovibrio hydrogenovorans]
MDNAVNSSLDMGLAGVKMASALLIILGLIFLGFYLLKRFGHKAGLGMGSGNMLKIVATLGIGPKKSIVVVRFLNKDLVLGVTDSRINLLTEIQVDEESDQKFARVLAKKADMDSSS